MSVRGLMAKIIEITGNLFDAPQGSVLIREPLAFLPVGTVLLLVKLTAW